MDWQHVSLEDLMDAFKQVEFAQPRPPAEFFTKFSPPKSPAKWTSRLKCNSYYFRTNYVLILLASLGFSFIRNPLAFLAVLLIVVAAACVNDPFALAFNDKLIGAIKKVHLRTALRLRAKGGGPADTNLGAKRRGQRRMFILMLPRPVFGAGMVAAGALLLYVSSGLVTLGWAVVAGVGLPLLHASLRSPNLKARLVSSEFKAVWRGYQADLSHDYTL